METTKNYLKTSLAGFAAFVLMSLEGMAEDLDSVAAASTLTEDEKFSEILSYIAMGVGTVAVIWIAYFLSNRSSGSGSSRPRIKRPGRITGL